MEYYIIKDNKFIEIDEKQLQNLRFGENYYIYDIILDKWRKEFKDGYYSAKVPDFTISLLNNIRKENLINPS